MSIKDTAGEMGGTTPPSTNRGGLSQAPVRHKLCHYTLDSSFLHDYHHPAPLALSRCIALYRRSSYLKVVWPKSCGRSLSTQQLGKEARGPQPIPIGDPGACFPKNFEIFECEERSEAIFLRRINVCALATFNESRILYLGMRHKYWLRHVL